MQKEQKVTDLRPKKLPAPGPVAKKPVRNSTLLSSPSNQSLSSGPAGNVQSTESPVPEVPKEPPIALVYEDIGQIFRKIDSLRSPNSNNIPTYENLPKNLPSDTELMTRPTDVDSEDRTYINQEQLRLAAEELARASKCKSSVDSVACELPKHGTYVKIRSQASVQSNSSDHHTTGEKEELLDAVKPDGSSEEIEQYYEVLGNMDLLLKNSKPIISSEPIQTERAPEEAASLPSPRPSETQQDSAVKLPTVKQTSKDKLNIKNAISGLKNSLLKEIRSHRNPPGADGAASGAATTKWTSVSQIPADVDQFTIDQVSQCLRLLNLGRYVVPFKERKMNGTFLAKASEEMLMQHFQMDALEAHQLVMFAQQGWRPE